MVWLTGSHTPEVWGCEGASCGTNARVCMGAITFELQKLPTHLPEAYPGSKGGGKGCPVVERGAFPFLGQDPVSQGWLKGS